MWLLSMKLAERIRGRPWNGGAVATTVIFGRATPALLAAELRGQSDRTIDATCIARVTDRRAGMADGPIAIVAMAGRFPGAADVEAFWQNLCEARDTIRHFDADTLDPAVSAEDRADPAYVPARGVVDDVEVFDAAIFGIGPAGAELVDPQQRIFLDRKSTRLNSSH